MKKVKGKKLELKKLNVAKLSESNMSHLVGGRKSGEPDCTGGIVFNSLHHICKTKQVNCTAPTVIGF